MVSRLKTLERPYVALFSKTEKSLRDAIASPYRFSDSRADENFSITPLGVHMATHGSNAHVAPRIQGMKRWVSQVEDISYTYDKAGNITSIVDHSGNNNVGSTTYTYDNLYRLQSATLTGAPANYTQSYVYDWLGNLTSKSDQGLYTYAQTGYTNPDAATQIGTTNFMYDNAGNLLTSGNGTATSTYAWDYRNRMAYSIMNGTSSAYTYDVSDQRSSMAVKKGTQATSTTYYWSPQYQTMGATTTMYIFGGGQLLATIEGNGKSTTTAFAHTDHLGSVVVESSATGTALQTLAYYPYGDSRLNQQASPTFGSQKRFLGQFSDDVGMNYLNARYQSGSQGRFLSIDPISRDIATMPNMAGYILDVNQGAGQYNQTTLLSNPQMLNFYAYANGNPITKSDPSGLASYGDMGFSMTINSPGSQYISALKYNSLKAFQSGVNTVGKTLTGGTIITAGMIVAPTATIGALLGVAERKTSDAQTGQTSTNGQLIGAGFMGAVTAYATAEAGIMKTLAYTAGLSTGGSIAIDGSIQPIDVASNVVASLVAKLTGNTLTTKQTAPIMKDIITSSADYVTNTAVTSALTPKSNKQK